MQSGCGHNVVMVMYNHHSYVGRPGNSHGYIVAQAPTDSTVSDFWRMIWEHGVHVVVALSNDTPEECAHYWPWKIDEPEEYELVISGSWINEGFTVTMTTENPCNIGNCVIRTFHLSSTIEPEERTVKQFHYTGWPINGELVKYNIVLNVGSVKLWLQYSICIVRMTN